uniref:winged helix-turn-helix domain-containing protein n=3 Tax=Enterobacterales TaxID=91347 RepID=UPI002B05E571
MEYKINKVINFRDDDGKIWSSLNPDKSVRLSIIPAKILSYLLENSKTIVKRNDLLDDIWNKNGLQASNNSLSQNISMLRKILQD